mmetsp:Transcript_142991/g.356340  ORF Transcript_142991/g.356340 Transcript_142991/m.356340 type:complete len:269 (-) Transcript_142991:23-829(-)
MPSSPSALRQAASRIGRPSLPSARPTRPIIFSWIPRQRWHSSTVRKALLPMPLQQILPTLKLVRPLHHPALKRLVLWSARQPLALRRSPPLPKLHMKHPLLHVQSLPPMLPPQLGFAGPEPVGAVVRISKCEAQLETRLRSESDEESVAKNCSSSHCMADHSKRWRARSQHLRADRPASIVVTVAADDAAGLLHRPRQLQRPPVRPQHVAMTMRWWALLPQLLLRKVQQLELLGGALPPRWLASSRARQWPPEPPAFYLHRQQQGRRQ